MLCSSHSAPSRLPLEFQTRHRAMFSVTQLNICSWTSRLLSPSFSCLHIPGTAAPLSIVYILSSFEAHSSWVWVQSLCLPSFVRVHTRLVSASPLAVYSWLPLLGYSLTSLLPCCLLISISSPRFFTSEPSTSHWALLCPPSNFLPFPFSARPSLCSSVRRITLPVVRDRGSDKQQNVPTLWFWKMDSLTHKHFDLIRYTVLYITPQACFSRAHTLALAAPTDSDSIYLLSLIPKVWPALIVSPITIITTAPPSLAFRPCSSYIITQLFVSYFRSKLCPPSLHKWLPIFPWAKSLCADCSNWAANGCCG